MIVDARRYTDLELYRRMLRWARPYWPHLGGLFLLSLLSTPLALLGPIPLKIAVDSVLGDHPLPSVIGALLPAANSDAALLAFAVGLLVVIALARQLQELAVAFLSTYIGQKLVLAFRSRLFGHAQRLSLAYHDARGTSESTSRIQWDAPSIQHVAVNGVIPFVTAGLTVASMIFVTARLDGVLAIISLAVAPALFLLTRSYRKPLRRRYHELRQVETTALGVIQEVLTAVRVVKAFGKEDAERDRFHRESRASVRARIRLELFQGGFDLLIGLTTALGTALVLLIGIRHVQAGLLTLGELLLVMAYLAQLYAPLRTISAKAADIQSSLASAERAFALLDEAQEVPERPHARALARAAGRVAFRDVSFGYATNRVVLNGISFAVEPGSSVGIAGPTGAGKTTLVNLLTRFYDPTAGTILLDGVDLRDYRLADLRNQFAIVLQDPVLFSTSIGENIGYARPKAGEPEIVAAARAAGAHDFISALPEGYDTPVGERGMRLSGGERQRISLARAFLKNAPILILDEPTSSVDTGTEAIIMDAMRRLMRDRTTFMIAHRLSTLDHCDVRLELAAGRLVAFGPADAPRAAHAAPA